ncbi:T9SS type A sorting domain-containing protein [Haliscomenobacter sp.]|uniref:T9SS type A sorting domain-containing protein n=1 Tax=Haliscomenobacter sp. TaxID=2717303 RepID=UPI003BAC0313
MKAYQILLLFCCWLNYGHSQSIRELGEIRTPWVCYSSKRELMYAFLGQEEGGPGRIQIRDPKFGKVLETIPTDALPRQTVLSKNERYIYFYTSFPLKIQRLNLDDHQISTLVTLPDSVHNLGQLSLLPFDDEKFFFSWSNNNGSGLHYFNGKTLEFNVSRDFTNLMFQNDSTFFAPTQEGFLQEYLFSNEKITPGKRLIQSRIIDRQPTLWQNDTLYSAMGDVWKLVEDSLIVLKQGRPYFANRYSLNAHPASAYYYIYVDGFDRDTVYKYPKGSWQSLDSWIIGADLMQGTYLFTVRLLAEDDFYVSRTPGLLVRRCSGKNQPARIKEGTQAFACLSLSPILSLHAAAPAYEYLWSNGATTSGVDLTTVQSIQLKTGDSTGCLSNWSEVCNVGFPEPHAGPQIDYFNGEISLQFCKKQTLIFIARQSSVEGFEWSNGVKKDTLRTSEPGQYRVRSFIRNGCPGLWSPYVKLEQLPDTIPQTPVIRTEKGNFDFCMGEKANLLAPSGYTYYVWSRQETRTPVFSTNTPLGMYLQVGNDLRCLSNTSATVNVRFNPVPSKPKIQRLGNLLATNNFGENHAWSKNGRLIPGNEGQFLEIETNGKYTVITNARGCFSPVSDTLEVIDLLFQGNPNKRNTLRLRLSPNPVGVEMYITLDGQNSSGRLYRISDLEGKIHQLGYVDNNGKIQVSTLPRGMYILSLLSSNFDPLASKFFKE